MGNWSGPWLFWITLFCMGLAVLACLVIGLLQFAKRSGSIWANRAYGSLLLLAACTQLHFLLDFGGGINQWPAWRYWPIYFTLWLPVLLFFYLKLILFPAYRPRWSDLKHFVLPLGQLLYFVAMWLVPHWRPSVGRQFYSPFYGGLEQALFLFMIPLYMWFSFEYFRRSRALSVQHKHQSGKREGVSFRPASSASANPSTTRIPISRTEWYAYMLMRWTMAFWLVYAVVALVDFAAYNFGTRDLRKLSWYASLGALSFSGMLYWWATYGLQVLIWGRRLRVGRRKRITAGPLPGDKS